MTSKSFHELEWRPCPGWPDYEVSEQGDLRRIRYRKGYPAGRLVKQQAHQRGYMMYQLRRGAKRVTLFAHRAVCEAWHGPCPVDKEQVAHFDGRRDSNHYSNLRWATRLENEADKLRHGTYPQRENHPNARLTWDDVRAIRAEYSSRVGHAAELAERYGVTKCHIRHVAWEIIWKEPRTVAP
jgi:hypothetical protein